MSTTAAPTGSTSITAATFERLSAELAELTGPRRDAIAQQVLVARQAGKIEEGSDYTAVKEEERLLEDRISVIQATLHDATVLGQVTGSDTVVVGSSVTVLFDGDDADDAEVYLIGDTAERAGGVEVCTPGSPLGKVLLGARAGDVVTYRPPLATAISVTVVAIG